LSEEDINRCFKDIEPLTQPRPGMSYIAGLDLGVSHDHAAVMVLEVDVARQRVREAVIRAWAPDPKTGEIYLPEVEETCLALSRLFRVGWFGYDPHQAV